MLNLEQMPKHLCFFLQDKHMSYNDIKLRQSYYYYSKVDKIKHYYYVCKKDSSGIKYIHMYTINNHILNGFSYNTFEGTSIEFMRSFENLSMAIEINSRKFIKVIFDAKVM